MAYSDSLKVPKKTAKGDLPSTKEDWVSYINKCHDWALELRRRHELQWVVNLAYYKGYQDLLYDPVSGFLSMSRDGEMPITINRIGAFVEGKLAKLTKNRPIASVLPNTTDREDINAAKFAHQALRYLWRKIDMDAVYEKLNMFNLLYGCGFVKTCWDPKAGDKYQDPIIESDETLLLADNEEGIETEDIFMGEVSTKAKSPFAILPSDETISTIPDQTWLIEREHIPASYLETVFPHLQGKLSKKDQYENKTQYERALERLGAPQFSHSSILSNDKKFLGSSQCLAKTFMMKPNYQYEEGLFAVVIDKELAMIDVFPKDYGDNVYPIVKFEERVDGSGFWPQATVERVIPVQKAINTLKQKKVRNAVLMANGKWLLPKGSQVHEEALTDEEGEVIEYNPAVPAPHQAVIAPLPNYVSELGQELIIDFRDVSGQRETSQNPSANLTASVAMQTQAELTDEILGPLIKRIGRGMERVANQQLLIMDAEYIEPRKIKILGEDGPMGVQWMSNADFRHSTDVHIEIDTLFPDLKAAKKQTLIDLWDRRIITDPQDFLEAFRFGDFDKLLNKVEKLKDEVYLDIQRIKKGKEPEFNPFGNHMLYVKEMTEFMNTPEFLKLIPERKQLMIAVVQQHMQALMGSLPNQGEPMAQQNQNSVGTPSGPQNTIPR